jgi:2-hydroxy-3-oxopropionate reductase
MMLDRNFNPGFRINLHIKDLNNVLNTARAISTSTPLTENVMIMMTSLRDAGLGDADHSALVRFYEQLAGIELKR